jgi:hypothetical protein
MILLGRSKLMKLSNSIIRNCICVWAIIVFTVAMLFLPAIAPLHAQTTDQDHIFTVYNVSVDATANNARSARSQALATAQVTAFDLLVRKISLEDRLIEATPLSIIDIRNLVSGIVVRDERTSARRYLAELDVSFNKTKVLEYLGINSLPYTELTGGPLLLLPIYEYGGVSLLFEARNPWLQAIKGVGIENHLYKFKLPAGDFEDQLMVGNADLLRNHNQGLQNRFSKLSIKYNSADILIIRAWWSDVGANGLKNLHFSYGRGLSSNTDEGTIIASRSYSQEDMFRIAANTIFSRLDLEWKEQTLTTFGAFNEIKAHIFAQSAEQWVDIIERLEATPIVRAVEIEKLAVPVSKVNIVYSGVFEQLSLVLKGVGLILVEKFDGWYLEKISD